MTTVDGNIDDKPPIATGAAPDKESTRWRSVGKPLDDTTKASNPTQSPYGSVRVHKVKNAFKFVREDVSLLHGRCIRWWKQDRPFLLSDLRHDIPEYLDWTWNNFLKGLQEKKASLLHRVTERQPEQKFSTRRKPAPARVQRRRKNGFVRFSERVTDYALRRR